MATLRNPVDWLLSWFRGGDDEGTSVTPESSLRLAAVWYAINRITGHVAQLPINCLRRLDRGAEYDKSHPGNKLLRGRPNKFQTPFQFKRQIQGHALMWGNGRALVYRNGGMIELLPMMPDRTRTIMVDGEKFHVTKPDADVGLAMSERDADGVLWEQFIDGRNVLVAHDDNVLHLHGFSYDGVEGCSLFEAARKSWENALGTLKQVSSQAKKGPTVRMMLQAPQGVFRDEGKAKEFLDNFRKQHGNDMAGEAIGMLREGVTANVMTMNNRDAQFIEQRLFDRQDVALWFQLESILGDDTSQSYNTLEQKNLAYLSNCLMTWLVGWEEELNYKLLTPAEFKADSHYFKFNTASLLRSDFKSTVETLSNGISALILSPNEAREKLDMNPYEGGDVYANPFTTSGSADDDDDAAVMSRLKNMIGVEVNRVRQGAKSRDFTTWATTFYKSWAQKLGDVIVELGGDAAIAIEHCDESLDQLAGALVTAESSKRPLVEVIEEVLSGWDTRLAKIAGKI